jgi:acyl carrier protein
MKREEINKQVISVIADELGCDINEISQQSNMVEDLGADSLDAVEILMLIEDAFNIRIPDTSLQQYRDKVHTVKDVCDLVEKFVND